MGHTYIIAEAGVNHNGSIEIAKQLIDAAVEAGADAVKFQTFKSEKIVKRQAIKAQYQMKTTDSNETQLEMLKKLELDETMHQVLIEYCNVKKIQFLSTPFDLESVDLLANTFDLPMLKVPSGEISNGPLLLKMARTMKPIVMSTGMCTIADVESALAILAFGYQDIGEEPSMTAFLNAYCSEEGQQQLKERVTLLHCTSEYPAPFNEVNLKMMDTLSHAFHLPVGYSDHTNGIAIPIAAVARGAKVIEKHFTLDRNMLGPDHKASLEPDELKQMVQSIRQVEVSIGSPNKKPAPSELNNKDVVRKSLVAARDIQAGEIFTEENLTFKRPGFGVSPMQYWEYLGQKAVKDYLEDDMI
ncbi:N-acetylneuraminate synthase [Cohnella panacarvi]|uniref:N-acetylneuraminate synthase n=1 Tax=Cohnella panacarvi TaxID=400776 RepID=UPI000554CE99|nr:N-acetylneuraminate synthase [Cohnella panacarvi]